jgi:3-oxoacyl-[acyl-carrier-protein] synthase I
MALAARTPLPGFPITAYAELSAAGGGRGAVLAAGERGQSPLGAPPGAPDLATRCGVVAELPPLPPELATFHSRVLRIAHAGLSPMLGTVQAAVRRWTAPRVAIVVGTSTGGIAETEVAFATWKRTGSLPDDYSLEGHHAFDSLVELLARLTGARGVRYAVSTACASSLKVFGAAQRLLATGMADAVLVGGADSLCATTLRGFGGLRLLSAGACRPFDGTRDGINIGEGAGFVLVERHADGPAPHLLAVGEGSDAHHMTAPHPEGRGAVEAMRAALAAAGLEPDAVDYVHAHGTGTPLNDRVEADAIAGVFGTGTPVSSTKGITGHLLGAAGALSAVTCLEALRAARLPVNVGLTQAEPDMRVHLVSRPEGRRLTRVLANAFAFGGCNASLLLGEPGGAPQPLPACEVRVLGTAFWAAGFPTFDHLRSGRATEPLPPEAALLAPRARGRASPLTRMFADVLGQLGTASAPNLAEVPMVYASAYGEMATTLSLLESLAAGETLLSPIRFQASVHNTAAGIFSIQMGNRAFSTAIAAGPRTAAMALVEAMAWLNAHGGEIVVAVADERAPDPICRGQSYPAVAAALHLAAALPGDRRPALGTLRGVTTAPLPPRPAYLSAFDENPAAGSLALLDRIAEGQSGPVALEARDGEGYVVELTVG